MSHSGGPWHDVRSSMAEEICCGVRGGFGGRVADNVVGPPCQFASPPLSGRTQTRTEHTFVLEDPTSFLLYSRVPHCGGYRGSVRNPRRRRAFLFSATGSDRVWWTAISFVNSAL